MIEGLKPYPEYKNPRLPWLDAIPNHWEMIPNRALMKDQRQVVGERAADYTLLSLTLQGVIARDMVNPKGKFPAQFNTYKVVRPNDMIFCLFDIDETPRGVGLANRGGMITGAYDVFSPTSRVDPRFLNHYYRFVDDGKLMKPLYTGLRKTIQRGTFAGLKTPCPPLDEQAAIVRFLDHANRKIDGFIRAKRKLIGLLNEQKQAIIHRAVTRGLNPNAPLKPSGIPWLGDIPKHWEVRRLRTIVRRIEQGVSPQATGFLAEGDSWGVLKSGCVNHGVFRQTEHKQLAKNFVVDPSIVVRVGDILISRACGSPKLVGSVGKVRSLDYKLILSDKTFRAVFHPTVDTDFMVYAMNCGYYRQQVEQAISGAEGMANNLPLSELRSFVFPIPPLAEAREIAGNLDRELTELNTAIARTEREITLMQEYRTRLTADIVTGKLDVREAAAKLPDSSIHNAQPEESDMGLEPDEGDDENSDLERED